MVYTLLYVALLFRIGARIESVSVSQSASPIYARGQERDAENLPCASSPHPVANEHVRQAEEGEKKENRILNFDRDVLQAETPGVTKNRTRECWLSRFFFFFFSFSSVLHIFEIK